MGIANQVLILVRVSGRIYEQRFHLKCPNSINNNKFNK